jgi:hypothetical protein
MAVVCVCMCVCLCVQVGCVSVWFGACVGVWGAKEVTKARRMQGNLVQARAKRVHDTTRAGGLGGLARTCAA